VPRCFAVYNRDAAKSSRGNRNLSNTAVNIENTWMNAGPDRGKIDDDDDFDDDLDDEVADDESDDSDSDDDDFDDLDEEVGTQTVVIADDTFSETDISMEVNVEKLVAEFEKSQNRDARRKAEIRRRLEELAESRELDDTFAIDFDDED